MMCHKTVEVFKIYHNSSIKNSSSVVLKMKHTHDNTHIT